MTEQKVVTRETLVAALREGEVRDALYAYGTGGWKRWATTEPQVADAIFDALPEHDSDLLASQERDRDVERCQCGHTRADHEGHYRDRPCHHRCAPPWKYALGDSA